jgi:DNA-binding MarR family transcriptional regulator
MTKKNDVTPTNQILLNLLSGFYWLDEGLQSYLRARGWPTVTRPQSMVMANVVMGVRHPSEIARRLGVSRQAIHATLRAMSEMGVVKLVDDPNNMRVKMVGLTKTGEAMRRDAQQAMKLMTEELIDRIGQEAFDQAAATLARNWGAPLSFRPEDVVSD